MIFSGLSFGFVPNNPVIWFFAGQFASNLDNGKMTISAKYFPSSPLDDIIIPLFFLAHRAILFFHFPVSFPYRYLILILYAISVKPFTINKKKRQKYLAQTLRRGKIALG